MSFLKEIDSARMPQHVAIIMDGNGRWAKLRNEDRTEGHKEGVAAVRRVIEGATKIGLKYVTLYTFSTENWNRPSEEIDALMSLMVHAIVSETPDLLKNNIRLAAIGDLGRLPQETRKALSDCIEKTAVSTGTTMVLALSYSSRWEMLEAVKSIAKDFSSQELENISEKTISRYLTTNGIPDPDLLIRTGGEKRISNFLLWQLAYTELCFLDTLWPDFNEESFFEAIVYYQGRERRFGKISEQLTEK